MCGLAHMFSLDCFMTGCFGPPTASPLRFSPAAGQYGMPSAVSISCAIVVRLQLLPHTGP